MTEIVNFMSIKLTIMAAATISPGLATGPAKHSRIVIHHPGTKGVALRPTIEKLALSSKALN